MVLVTDHAIGKGMTCPVVEANREAIGTERRCSLLTTEVGIPQSGDCSRLGGSASGSRKVCAPQG